MHKYILYFSIALIGVVAASFGGIAYVLNSSLPTLDGHVSIPTLVASATVEFDGIGIPRIEAQTREDAFRLLGYVTARDRLFQMDLLRRKMSGRLAEIFGPEVIASDRWHRSIGFSRVASKILNSLPMGQRKVLDAYTEGVNQGIAEFTVLPFEFLMLAYSPEPWRPEDSVLATLAMYTALAWRGRTERSTTIMQAVFPKSVLDFFLPKTDFYTAALLSEDQGDVVPPLPVEELARILKDKSYASSHANIIRDRAPKRGSNAWVVAPSKSAGGRALLANDMHLELTVPNIWYRAELLYGDVHIVGLSLPGIPLIISGSNQHIAWGFTASGADTSDLILLAVDPQDPEKYRTHRGTERFGQREETIHIRGADDEHLTVRTTPWGPVLPQPLLGKLVALRWAALDPATNNFGLLNLDRAVTVGQALPLLNQVGGPPLYAFVADAAGNIGWTMTGSVPARFDDDGLFAYASIDVQPTWRDYIPPEALPRQVNPASGFLVSANQRMVDSDYPYVIGHYDWRGYRAYRITERLRAMDNITERDLLTLQLDTRTDFYRYYQRLALEVLEAGGKPYLPEMVELRRHLNAWNGRADLDSMGLGLLVEFRNVLMNAILAPYFFQCRALDPSFEYEWSYADRPLQRLIDAKLRRLLPDHEKFPDRNELLLALLMRSRTNLIKRFQVANLQALSWGRINKAHIVHPLSAAIPWFGHRLDMAEDALPGCNECVRNFLWDGGASERLVVAPGHEEDGILQMPAGQSGHPLSPYYDDQHSIWLRGAATPLLAGATIHRLIVDVTSTDQSAPQ